MVFNDDGGKPQTLGFSETVQILDAEFDRVHILTETPVSGWVQRRSVTSPEDAMAIVEERLRSNNKDFSAWFLKGTILRHSGRAATSINAFARAVELNLGNVNSYLG